MSEGPEGLRSNLLKNGYEVLSRNLDLRLLPSLEIKIGSEEFAVFVGFSLFPTLEPTPPHELWEVISRLGLNVNKCKFAGVGLANKDDAFDTTGTIPAMSIHRGDGCISRFQGLQEIPAPKRHQIPEGALVQWNSAASIDYENYEGWIDWDDANVFLQDEIIKRSLGQSSYSLDLTKTGLRKAHEDYVSVCVIGARTFLEYNGFCLANRFDGNTKHQLLRFFEGSTFGKRLSDLFGLDRDYPTSRRTPLGSIIRPLNKGEFLTPDNSAHRSQYLDLVGFDRNLADTFPFAKADPLACLQDKKNRSAQVGEVIESITDRYKLPSGVTAPLTKEIGKMKLSKFAKRHTDSVSHSMFFVLIRHLRVEIEKYKLSITWPAVNKQDSPNEELVGADYTRSSLDDLGFKILDLAFDIIGGAQMRDEIDEETAVALRKDVLVAGFSYPRADFF